MSVSLHPLVIMNISEHWTRWAVLSSETGPGIFPKPDPNLCLLGYSLKFDQWMYIVQYSGRFENAYKTILLTLRSAGSSLSLKHPFIFAPLLTQLNLDQIRIRKNHTFLILLIYVSVYGFFEWTITQILNFILKFYVLRMHFLHSFTFRDFHTYLIVFRTGTLFK